MRTLLLLFITLLIQSNTAFGQEAKPNNNTPDDSTNTHWKTFKKDNYSISYPESWSLNSKGTMGASFFISSPLSFKEDNFKENVNLIIQDLSAHNLNLAQFVEVSETQIKTFVTNGKILTSETHQKEGVSYQKLIFSGKQGIYDLVTEQYYWVIDNVAYVLTLSSEEAQYPFYKITGEKILDSFTFSKK